MLSKLFRLVAFFCIVATSSCFGTFGEGRWWLGRPSNHNESVYGVVRVAAGASLKDPTDRWSRDNLEVMRKALTEASRLGPTFILVEHEGLADIVLYNTELNCRVEIGRHTPGTKFAEIDPRCTTSVLELQTSIIHELGHVLGMQHICTERTETNSQCSNVGYGYAVLNPNITDSTRGRRLGSQPVYTGVFPQWEITELDILEFRRVWQLHHHRR